MGTTPPLEWGRAKRSKVKTYAEGEVGRWARAARDVCLPGVPVAALLGFAANGAVNENTTGWLVGDEAERAKALAKGRYPLKRSDPREGYGRVGGNHLHELGPFGVEGGKTPTPVATDPECPWVSLASSDAVVKVLGRPGVTGRDWYDAVADQTVIGVANLTRHLRAIRAKLDPRLTWPEDKPVSAWAYSLAMMSWSAGSSGCARHVNAYADDLAALPEEQRWSAFLRFAGAVDDPRAKHRADEYSALRTEQKRCAGMIACEFTGEDPQWLDPGLGPERDAVYAALVKASRSED
jgi:hypothetical protein